MLVDDLIAPHEAYYATRQPGTAGSTVLPDFRPLGLYFNLGLFDRKR
jgi:hypothetical protein